ncbi:MAG: GMC family oxidoreductase [Candidatus Competibacteraceae bacterium]|nr:GMC family oxidoreductase [Candidatus Competibacteraceae bacterium]
MKKRRFSTRWLRLAGVPEDVLVSRVELASNRVRRFPKWHALMYPCLLACVNNFGPLFLMNKWRAAHALSDDDFLKFCSCFREHSSSFVRLLAIFVFYPLSQVLENESSENQAYSHPLQSVCNTTPEWNDKEVADYIIIGTGAGGAPVAAELARKGKSVLIIEKGGLVQIESPGKVLEKNYVSQGFVSTLNGSTLMVFAGQTVGGTTSVNSGTSLNPLPECLSEWDECWGTHFSDGLLQPFLERVKEDIHICVPGEDVLSESSRLFREGMSRIGRHDTYILPRNIQQCKGSGRCAFGCPKGAKQSTDLAYLPQAIQHGAKLFHQTEALRIKDGKKNVEVLVDHCGVQRTFKAKKLIIAAGALFTPSLLRKNKLGSNFSRAGYHLQIHPATKVFAHFPNHYVGFAGIPQGMGYRMPAPSRVTLEGIHTPKSLTAPIISVGGKRFNEWMSRIESLASFGLMVRDRATGRVIYISGQPYLQYHLHPDDATDIASGLRVIAEAFFAAGAERVLMPYGGVSPIEMKAPDELNRIPQIHSRHIMLSGFHPLGTAGIGRVVDDTLKLFGSENIYICDASVLPSSPGVNPQVTVMALSLRLADHLIMNF